MGCGAARSQIGRDAFAMNAVSARRADAEDVFVNRSMAVRVRKLQFTPVGGEVARTRGCSVSPANCTACTDRTELD